ncbi:DNA binding domain-containing protein, excisionase family [Phyllobacterium sp. CL33Tsu]|uniref:helix-turn-helix domain-containing protein n=1 Tax=Phyllobacterium sp. CL33Tsu TaxID=1798191 RepID=UPI0008E78975|nr:helix-turn-helix domain-containing protein [Phyllobacterium sp. CL33Tsu]SFI65229.1 DNA binding domain-containing protein, excisionase family [Phyllobacterium sp. CL33Tsu]
MDMAQHALASISPLALSVDRAAAAAGIGRTKIYEAIKLGNLKARKAGRHTVILTDDLKTFLESLPVKEVVS